MASPVPLAPLGREATQTDRAVLGIRDLVLRGEFKAGERLPELALAELLGISRTPIRAALQKLAEEGLLEPAASTGYLVRSFSDNDIFDAIEVRGTIEGLAARLAAERGVSKLVLDEMRDTLAQIDLTLTKASPGAAHLSRYSALNGRFHALLLDASGSAMVARALVRVTSLPFAAADAFVAGQGEIPGSLEILRIAQLQHHEIVDAIEARSSARAEPLVREHARNARKNLELALRNGDAMKRFPGAPLIRRRGGA
ncbi:MAG TPA: GntR family transcriptional regulator [Rhodocyclaceae bacterium]|nr:GntR family transcriptional regulator [Rhodocyclaceae bacterium]